MHGTGIRSLSADEKAVVIENTPPACRDEKRGQTEVV